MNMIRSNLLARAAALVAILQDPGEKNISLQEFTLLAIEYDDAKDAMMALRTRAAPVLDGVWSRPARLWDQHSEEHGVAANHSLADLSRSKS